MPPIPKKYKVKLNSLGKIEELLQETYNQACQQITMIQDEMNKLANSTVLTNEFTDTRIKYAKAMNDFIMNKDKAIGRKLEIAKFMEEVRRHDGDVSKALSESEGALSESSLNWDELKNMIDKVENNEKKEIYKID